MAAISFGPMRDTQKISFTIAPVDRNGSPVAGSYSWSVSDPALGALSVSSDTLSAEFVAAAAGTLIVTVTDGSISDTATGAIVAAAVALNLVAGTPTDQ